MQGTAEHTTSRSRPAFVLRRRKLFWLGAFGLLVVLASIAAVAYFSWQAARARAENAAAIGDVNRDLRAQPDTLPVAGEAPAIPYDKPKEAKVILEPASDQDRMLWNEDALYEWVKVSIADGDTGGALERVLWIEKHRNERFPRIFYAKGVVYSSMARAAQATHPDDATRLRGLAEHAYSTAISEAENAKRPLPEAYNNYAWLILDRSVQELEPALISNAKAHAANAVDQQRAHNLIAEPEQRRRLANYLHTLGEVYRAEGSLAASHATKQEAYRRAVECFEEALGLSLEPQWQNDLRLAIHEVKKLQHEDQAVR